MSGCGEGVIARSVIPIRCGTSPGISPVSLASLLLAVPGLLRGGHFPTKELAGPSLRVYKETQDAHVNPNCRDALRRNVLGKARAV
jgi:hypothetical protein